MMRFVLAAGLAAIVMTGTPALAATSKQKMETCKFGADDQKLQGAARKAFMAKCMSNKDSPRGKPECRGNSPRYLFVNLAGRFSTKAAMPSFWSSVANSAWNTRRSKRTPSASVVSNARLTLSFAA